MTPARLAPSDVVRLAADGLRARPLRVLLSASGVALGIAAMVAVLGISSSSRADVERVLDRLGTDLLTVTPGSTLLGDDAQLPTTAVPAVERIGPVRAASATGLVDGATVRRTDLVPEAETSGVAVRATDLDLLSTLGARMRAGRWLDDATAGYPVVVLGSLAAERLGAVPGQPLWLGGQWFVVAGVLEPIALAPEVDRSALVGWTVAQERLGFDGAPTTVYERSAEDAVDDVRAVLAATVDPEHPEQVQVSRPSDALEAAAATDAAFTGLLLGLGAVALVVGGVGVANTMVVAVLERRGEIGLRRALGATRRQVRAQFLGESLLLSAVGGAGGVLLGAVVTAGWATSRGWPVVVPGTALGGAVVATCVVGGLAGVLPAVRASRLDPVRALAAP